MRRVLLIDRPDEHASKLKAALRLRGFETFIEGQKWRAVHVLRQHVPTWEFVVIVARAVADERLELLRELILASQQFHQSGVPEFLFASCVGCAPTVRGQIEKLGARYVRL